MIANLTLKERERETHVAKTKPVNTMELKRGVVFIFKYSLRILVKPDRDYETQQLAKGPGLFQSRCFHSILCLRLIQG